jgi:putative component of toxin-antitoxin plasmid stabilization module
VELQAGQRLRVLALRNDDHCPAEVFLKDLDSRAQSAFQAKLEHLCDIGYLRAPEHMRELHVPGAPPVFEIKIDNGPGYRLYVIRCGRDWVATHGERKPKDKQIKVNVRKARQAFDEWGGCEQLV